jgi:hypothetical protein
MARKIFQMMLDYYEDLVLGYLGTLLRTYAPVSVSCIAATVDSLLTTRAQSFAQLR